jgi:hypothetical protein
MSEALNITGQLAQAVLWADVDEPAPTFETMSAPDRPYFAVCLGVGRDSVAMLALLKKKGMRPDAILFANPRAEKPETYAYLKILGAWLEANDFPPVTIITHENGKRDPGLEGQMLRLGTIPSVAFNKSASCSDTWKQQPQKRHVKQLPEAQATFKRNRRVVFAIGYEAEECDRVRRATTYAAEKPSKYFVNWFPLVEEGITFAGVVELIVEAGLPVPIKSACFFCPSSKVEEIVWLAETHPGLFMRALIMEERALPKLTTLKGLGGRAFRWRELPCAQPFLAEVDRIVGEMPPTESKETAQTSEPLRGAIARVLALDDEAAREAAEGAPLALAA